MSLPGGLPTPSTSQCTDASRVISQEERRGADYFISRTREVTSYRACRLNSKRKSKRKTVKKSQVEVGGAPEASNRRGVLASRADT